MSDKQKYKQCDMRSGGCWRTSWLPAEFAKTGAWVRIDVQNWQIMTAYPATVTMEFLGHVRDAQRDRALTVS